MFFELWQQVFDGPKGGPLKSKWLKIADGLPWMEAKTKRNAARPVKLEIRPVRIEQSAA